MPPVTRVFTPGATDTPADTIRALHRELAEIGLPVTGTDVSSASPGFGDETSRQLREFQQLYRLPVTGNLDPATGAIMSLSAAAASGASRADLAAAVRSAGSGGATSPELEYWRARYAVLAGDYELASSVSARVVDLSDIRVDLGAVFTGGFEPGGPRAPEVPFPENFYTYRYTLMAQEDIDALRLAATASSDARVYLIAMRPANGSSDTFDPPHHPVVYPPPDPPASPNRPQRLADSALAWLAAVESWQFAAAEFQRERYASAVDACNRCQLAALSYFATYPDYDLRTTGTLQARIDELVWRIASDRQRWATLWQQINWRRQLLSLAELSGFDWPSITPGHIAYQMLHGNVTGSDQTIPPTGGVGSAHRQIFLDAKLLVMAAVLVPLARGEANRLRRQWSDAADDFGRAARADIPVPNANPPQTIPAALACEFIETPFARLMLVETTLGQADAEFKSRLSVEDEPDAQVRTGELAALATLAQDFESRHIPGAPDRASRPFQHLKAALTYSRVFDAVADQGEYAARSQQALDALHANIAAAIGGGVISSVALRSIGDAITVPTVEAAGSTLPGLTPGAHPHEPYLQFQPPQGQTTLRERNPRVYALLLQAEARRVQIWSGFNYLGYRDDYLPPWRFEYLLDRARYFAEHAKNAQRDYLNFLSNAENEEFKELSASQTVELEKANVQIEGARVDQSAAELTAAQESASLAELNAADAATRLQNYQDFDTHMSEMNSLSFLGSVASIAGGIAAVAAGDVPQGLAAIGGGLGQLGAAGKEELQRNLEEDNLKLAVGEAQQAAVVAHAQADAARTGLVVAALQRQAALLRHEYAIQNLQFMRSQTLNTEQWYRLAGSIRSVSDTYLHHAIEMSFLAQQAYNFESDSRLSVIRFDYDLSDVGAMLAADFLLRDLDTLEEDLVVSQQVRLQQVRYVLSLAREFPDALRTLADTGAVTVSLGLRQLERHLPGMFNLRIATVDVQPIALMDPARLAVRLTQCGTGSVRLKAQPGGSPLNSSDVPAASDWLGADASSWPVKIHVSPPETAVFTGVPREQMSVPASISANERAAFEGLPGASTWTIDLSARENELVPGTLSDVVVTFTMGGFYDSSLRGTVDRAAATLAEPGTTVLVSARQMLPDAFYALMQSGTLQWDVPARLLSLTGTPGELRNLALMLPLVPSGVEIGRTYCRYPIQIAVQPGAVTVLTALPAFTVAVSGLAIDGQFTGDPATQVTWDFGDEAPLATGAAVHHAYARPGRYEMSVRLVASNRLTEYRVALVVSLSQNVAGPLIVSPTISAGAANADGTVPVTIALPGSPADISLECAANGARTVSDGATVTLDLAAGAQRIDLLAIRELRARFYSRQRYTPADVVAVRRRRVSTNRTFDAGGEETTQSPNAFAGQVFGPPGTIISPVDRWTLELPAADNPWLATVNASDILEFDGTEVDDALLSVEFR
jgi:hypothetical protein